MLKASIDDMVALKSENARLKEEAEGKRFELQYCATH